MSTEQAFAKYNTSWEGLNSGDVAPRQAKYGKNALTEEKKSPILQFLGSMWNPLSWAMEVALASYLVINSYIITSTTFKRY